MHTDEGNIIKLSVSVPHKSGKFNGDVIEHALSGFHRSILDNLDESIHPEHHIALVFSIARLSDTICIEDDDISNLGGYLYFFEYFRNILGHTERDSSRLDFEGFSLRSLVDDEVFMSRTSHIHFLFALVPSDHEEGHEDIGFDTRLEDLICFDEDIGGIFDNLRKTGDKSIDDHHNESGCHSVSGHISDIHIIIIPLSDDIITISSNFRCRLTVRDNVDRWDDDGSFFEDVFLDLRSEFNLGFENPSCPKFILEVFENLETFIEKAGNKTNIGIDIPCTKFAAVFGSRKEEGNLSFETTKRFDISKMSKNREDTYLHECDHRKDILKVLEKDNGSVHERGNKEYPVKTDKEEEYEKKEISKQKSHMYVFIN